MHSNVAIVRGEIGDACAGGRIDPEAGAHAIGVARMAEDSAAAPEQIVVAARRVDRQAQLAGTVDPLDAIARLRSAVAAIPNVLTAPGPDVTMLDINLVGPVIAVRPYTHTDNYWQVYFATNEAIVKAFRPKS